MNCDLCGKEAELLKVIIEGTELNVCKDCSRYGRVIGRVKPAAKPAAKTAKPAEKELIQVIVSDYAARVKSAREKKGLKQQELAKAISEKESLIRNIEAGRYEPSIDLAAKLEKFLRIVLVEQHEEVQERTGAKKSGEFTIGDFVRVRKK
jgi:putative transcription factor